MDLLAERIDGASNETVTELLAEDRWEASWTAENQRRIAAGRQAAERQKAEGALDRQDRAARLSALRDRPRPLASWTAKRLGVHPSISGLATERATAGGTMPNDFVLPAYVPRAHDARLRAHLKAAAADAAPQLIVITGESCTGKTRTAYEAVKATIPDDFTLLFPTDTDGLLEVLSADALDARTVLWLNEAQNYLIAPAGEVAAAALLRRLDAAGPLIVLATLWPDHDRALTAPPLSGQADPYRHARALLAQARRIAVPAAFTDDLDTAREAATPGSPLAAALESGTAELTQTLAAGPDLIRHYEQPTGPDGHCGSALIQAAMDAHRLGVTSALSLDLLRDAAPGYLSERERAAADTEWFTGALAYARTLIKRTTHPLQEVPRTTGMGAQPGMVRLVDYLQQHGRRTRRPLCPPTTFWRAAATHLQQPSDLVSLGDAARMRFRLRWASRLYQRAADAGEALALQLLGDIRDWVGDLKGAEVLYEQAIDAGQTSALVRLGLLKARTGQSGAAEQFYEQAATAHDLGGLAFLAASRRTRGDLKGAEAAYRQAIDEGAIGSLTMLADLYEEAGDREGALALHRQAIEAGATSALLSLVRMQEEAGNSAAAETLYQEAADAGATEVLTILAEMHMRKGDPAKSRVLMQRAADAGDLTAVVFTTTPSPEATKGLRIRAVHAGDAGALTTLALLQEAMGDLEGAASLLTAAADIGDQQRTFSRWWPYGLNADGTPTPPW
ncbi:tetratricopeptide repeat protein [Streptomyces sp. NPDC059894]|uniref:tetratricopeptide repeat protein n=1 Tax=unclassified Streptomyces TaxID=2593676 RepID=UPI0036487958